MNDDEMVRWLRDDMRLPAAADRIEALLAEVAGLRAERGRVPESWDECADWLDAGGVVEWHDTRIGRWTGLPYATLSLKHRRSVVAGSLRRGRRVVSGEAAGAVPDDVRAAVTEAVFRCTGADVGMLAYVSSAVLSVPAIADALQALDAVQYCLRAEVRWLETQPASEWATTRQVAILDVIRLLDGGPWVEREHVTDGERCWCDPQVETVPAKKSATEAADSSIEGNDQ